MRCLAPNSRRSDRGESRIFERGALFWKSIGAGSKGATGHVPPRFFEEGPQCYEEMYLDLSITRDDNAMLSGSDGQNYQSGGGAWVVPP